MQLIYDVLISAVQQSESGVHTSLLFHILFHDGLSQDIEWRSLRFIR